MEKMKLRLQGLYQYKNLLKQLVVRDIKLKYRRSVLGYLWSILNPLLIMLVMVVVFSSLFRFDIPNFPVYLLTGQMLFGFMTEATGMAIGSITGSAPLIKKTYVPKYIFTLSRVTSSLVNLLFSMTALVLVMLITRTAITWHILLAPLVIVELYMFSLGLGLFLSCAAVFFRDIQYIWGVVTTAWTYLTPIFYPISIWPEEYAFLFKLNPMYSYIGQFRDVVLYGRTPGPNVALAGAVYALGALVVGIWTFYKGQDRFILYI